MAAKLPELDPIGPAGTTLSTLQPITAGEMDALWLALPGSVLTQGRLHLAAVSERQKAASRSRGLSARSTGSPLFMWAVSPCFRENVVSKALTVWVGRQGPRGLGKVPTSVAVLLDSLPERGPGKVCVLKRLWGGRQNRAQQRVWSLQGTSCL